MNYNNIYSCGSSFSCGGGLNLPTVKKLYDTLHNIQINDDISNSYPNIICKTNNLNIVNESIPGGSSNRMIRKVYDYLHNNQSQVKSTLFLIEIPPTWRDEFYSNTLDKMVNVTWGFLKNDNDDTFESNGYSKEETSMIKNDIKNYFTKFINIDIEIKKTMNNLLGLLSYFKLNNIQYVIINGFEFYTFLLKNNLKNNYNFYWVDGTIEPLNLSFVNKNLTIASELNNKYIDNHLGYFGNKYVANDLNNHIKKIIL